MTDRRLAEFQRPRDIAARPDQRHQWALAGDPRGTYVDPESVVEPDRLSPSRLRWWCGAAPAG